MRTALAMAVQAVLPSLLLSSSAYAGATDALHAYASVGVNYDDNLFRLGDGNPGYDNTRSDRYSTAEAGLTFNQIYGRQAIGLQAKISRVSFDHFSQLDYNGKDMLADWGWHIGNALEGKAGYSYSQVLAPYTDVSTRERNLRVLQREYFNASWAFQANWRLRGGVNNNRYRYDLASQAYNNREDRGMEWGVDYYASTGSSIGLQVDRTKYEYDLLRPFGKQLVDAGTTQDDVSLNVNWRPTGVTNVQFLGGRSRRTHSFFAERDSSGFNALIKGTTLWDGQLKLDASVWRQYGGVESNLVSYSLNTGTSIAANWVITSKIQAKAQIRRDRRQFKGLLANTLPAGLSDTLVNQSLGLSYAILPSVGLNASVFRDTRNGLAAAAFGNGNYRAKGVSFNVSLQY